MKYDAELARGYAEKRALSDADLELWLGRIEQAASAQRPRRVLDLGCGTGRFTAPLARRLGAQTVGIDPSAEMLAQRAGGPAYLRAPAERLPLAASSVDLVFTSMTLHHLDLRSAVCELSRVLRSPGTVLIRSPLSDYLRSPFYEFFPEARAADQVRTPSRKQVETAMAGHGLRLRSFELVTQTVARNLRHYLERMQARPYSSFAQLAEDEFSQGLARLERAAGRTPSAPVEDPVPFLCFGR